MKPTEIVACIALTGMLGWFGYNLFLSTVNAPVYDRQSFCQKNAPSKEVVLLVDPSTRLDRVQKAELRDVQQHLILNMQPNSRFSLYRLQETVQQPPVPEFQACYPGPMQAGSGAVQRRMAKAFNQKLDDALHEMMDAKSDQRSPLLEGFYALTSADSWEPEGMDIFIFSDMIQNTAMLDQYRREIGAEKFMRQNRAFFAEHPIRLNGSHVYIFLINNNLTLANMGRIERHKRFWARLLGRQGHAASVSYCTLDASLKRHCQTGWP